MGARLLMSPADADGTVAAFTSTMTPGSYRILSAGTSTNTRPALIDRLRSAYAATSDIAGRTVPEIAAWFTGLDLAPPGWSTFKHGDPAANSPARR